MMGNMDVGPTGRGVMNMGTGRAKGAPGGPGAGKNAPLPPVLTPQRSPLQVKVPPKAHPLLQLPAVRVDPALRRVRRAAVEALQFPHLLPLVLVAAATSSPHGTPSPTPKNGAV